MWLAVKLGSSASRVRLGGNGHTVRSFSGDRNLRSSPPTPALTPTARAVSSALMRASGLA